jgi:formylglycine-generating enzyme required for sulfatase activity
MAINADPSDKTTSESWWHTLPGKITALTATVSAVGGLLAAIHAQIPFVKEFIESFSANGSDPKCEVVSRPAALPTGSGFRDCKCCPEMIVLPDGSAISKYEVTKQEYATFVDAFWSGSSSGTGNCYRFKMVGPEGSWQPEPNATWKNPGFAQQDDEPVVCVSWNDARSYVKWLSQITGENYRIPTLAEMENASGVTSGSVFWKKDDQPCASANVHDEQSKKINGFPWANAACNDGFPKADTALRQMAGKNDGFRPNSNGVFHLIGNAYEWLSTDKGCPNPAGQVWIWGGSWTAAPDKAVAQEGWCQSKEFRAPDISIRVVWSK